MDVVWLFNVGECCLMSKDSRNKREWGSEANERILKSLYWIVCLQDAEWERMAECSLTFNAQPVRWLTPLWESIRTFSIRLVHPTYVPKLHFGQENKYTVDARINSDRESLKRKRLPIVKVFLNTNLNST